MNDIHMVGWYYLERKIQIQHKNGYHNIQWCWMLNLKTEWHWHKTFWTPMLMPYVLCKFSNFILPVVRCDSATMRQSTQHSTKSTSEICTQIFHQNVFFLPLNIFGDCRCVDITVRHFRINIKSLHGTYVRVRNCSFDGILSLFGLFCLFI